MHDECKNLHGSMLRAHWDVATQLAKIERAVAACGDERELADAVYALKVTRDLAEDLRKATDRLKTLMEHRLCDRWVQIGDGDPVRTEYCTASPDVKTTVITPKVGTPEYDKLREFFGVPSQAPFVPHWNKMIDRISEDMAQGKPLPPGCDPKRMIQVPKVVIRKKRTVSDADEGQVMDPISRRLAAEGVLCLSQGDHEAGERLLREAVSHAKRAGDEDEANAAPPDETSEASESSEGLESMF